MNKLLALASVLYATPGLGSALASETIRHHPKHPPELFEIPLHLLPSQLEVISLVRTVAFFGYMVISATTDNPKLFLSDVAGYALPFAIEYGYKGTKLGFDSLRNACSRVRSIF